MTDLKTEGSHPFLCHHCGFQMCYRRGNTIVVTDEMEIELKTTHKIRCPECGRDTRFSVTAKRKPIDRSEELRIL